MAPRHALYFIGCGCVALELTRSCDWPPALPRLAAVAVVRRATRNIFMGNLGGRRSCHGHMYSPAGWLLPHAHNMSAGHNGSSSCNPDTGRP